VVNVAAESEEDVAVVATEAGTVEKLALGAHPLDDVHPLGAEVANFGATAT
jgi:hypothetical protein